MDKVIVYRSQFETQQDQFWSNHPEIIVYAFYIAFAIIAIYAFWAFIKPSYHKWKRRNK